MSTLYLIADTHFGHKGMCHFTDKEGVKLRPWATVEEMDEAMVANWNSVVKPHDKVYHLGDVVINRKALPTLTRLNGTKVLIKGNHDIFKLSDYSLYFKDIRAYRVLDNIICSHIPIHTYCKARFKGNIHGHTHSNIMDDPWYQSVCVEQINYTPISWEVMRARFNDT